MKVKAPAAVLDAAGLDHKGLAVLLQRHAHRAGLGRHRPFAPGHDAAHVHLQAVADRLCRQHELVAAARKVSDGEHRALERA